MHDMKDTLVCPGCHRQYKRTDIRADGLVCPACGRQVVALVNVDAVSSEKVIEDYLNRGIAKDTEGLLIAIGVLSAGLVFCLFVKFYWFVFAVSLFFGFGCMTELFEMVRWRKVRTIFKRVNYDLEKGLAEHRKYMKALDDPVFMDDAVGKDLEQNLRARLSATVTMQTSYVVNSEVDDVPVHDVTSTGVGCCHENMSARQPPSECPNCGAPYKIADYSGKNVKCRRCGTSVEIENAVDGAEIMVLVNEMLEKSVEKHAFERRVMGKMSWFLIALGGVFWYFADSTGTFLRSCGVVPLYLGMAMRLGAALLDNEFRMRRSLLEKKDFSLFDFEYAVKKDNPTGDDRKDFDEFKGKILDLYKSRGPVLKGSVLS